MFCLSTPQQGPINQRPLSLTPSSWSIPVLFLFTEREQFIYQLPLQYLKTFKDTFCFVPSAAPLSRAFCFVGFSFFPRLSCPPSFLIYCMPSATPPDYLSITAVRLFFSQVCHSLLSAAASSSRLPAPHISLTDYTVDCVLLSVH